MTVEPLPSAPQLSAVPRADEVPSSLRDGPPLSTDAPPRLRDAPPGANDRGALFGALVDDVAAVLRDAQRSEDAFARGTGTLRAAIYDRARATAVLDVVAAAARRTASALQTVLQMQV